MKKLKVVSDFDEKMLEYGKALNELETVDKMCRTHPNGWPSDGSQLLKNLDVATKNLERTRTKAETAFGRYAKHVAKQK